MVKIVFLLVGWVGCICIHTNICIHNIHLIEFVCLCFFSSRSFGGCEWHVHLCDCAHLFFQWEQFQW